MQGNKCISFVFLSDKQLIWKITFFSWTRQILHLFYFPKHVVLNWKQLYLSVVTDVFHWVIWPLTASNLYMHYIFLRTLYIVVPSLLRTVCVLAAVLYAVFIQMKHQDIIPLSVLYWMKTFYESTVSDCVVFSNKFTWHFTSLNYIVPD